jgi:hypothetical protein
MTGRPRFWTGAALAVTRHPRLWATAVVQAGRLARPQWWRHPPFLPVPHREYLRHRLETQYGPDHEPEPHDVITYLEWCRQMNSLNGRRRKVRLLRRRSAKSPPSRIRRGAPR